MNQENMKCKKMVGGGGAESHPYKESVIEIERGMALKLLLSALRYGKAVIRL